jgi:hypothetical protein
VKGELAFLYGTTRNSTSLITDSTFLRRTNEWWNKRIREGKTYKNKGREEKTRKYKPHDQHEKFPVQHSPVHHLRHLRRKK